MIAETGGHDTETRSKPPFEPSVTMDRNDRSRSPKYAILQRQFLEAAEVEFGHIVRAGHDRKGATGGSTKGGLSTSTTGGRTTGGQGEPRRLPRATGGSSIGGEAPHQPPYLRGLLQPPSPGSFTSLGFELSGDNLEGSRSLPAAKPRPTNTAPIGDLSSLDLARADGTVCFGIPTARPADYVSPRMAVTALRAELAAALDEVDRATKAREAAETAEAAMREALVRATRGENKAGDPRAAQPHQDTGPSPEHIARMRCSRASGRRNAGKLAEHLVGKDWLTVAQTVRLYAPGWSRPEKVQSALERLVEEGRAECADPTETGRHRRFRLTDTNVQPATIEACEAEWQASTDATVSSHIADGVWRSMTDMKALGIPGTVAHQALQSSLDRLVRDGLAEMRMAPRRRRQPVAEYRYVGGAEPAAKAQIRPAKAKTPARPGVGSHPTA